MESGEKLEVATAADLRAWLTAHAGREQGLWLVTAKAGSAYGRSVTYSEIVDELLCFGWIDSRPRSLDTERSMLWISPRKASSAWSRVNKEKIARLEATRRLDPRGRALVERARQSGAWDRINDAEDGVVPPDLAAALASHGDAATHFDAFPRSVKRAILEWILQAKTQETRAKRVLETAEKAARNERANQWRP